MVLVCISLVASDIEYHAGQGNIPSSDLGVVTLEVHIFLILSSVVVLYFKSQ